MPLKFNPEAIRTLNRRLEAGELKLIDRTGRSKAWELFAEVVSAATGKSEGGGIARCKQCKKYLAFDQQKTGTSSLTRHTCLKEKGPSSVASTSATSQTMRGFLRPPVSKTKCKAAKRNITKSCVSLCCLDLRPFEIIKGRGFLELAQVLITTGAELGNVTAADIIPSPSTIARHISEEANRERATFMPILQKLVSNKLISATTDMWCDDYKKQSFTCITVHWLTKQWELKNRVLCTCAFPLDESKTADNVLSELKTRFESFGVPNSDLDKVVFVTDQGTNIVAALHEHNRLNCSAHLINTILRNTFQKEWLVTHAPSVQKTLAGCKALVAHLKHTGLSSSVGGAVQQEVETRWNSRLQMLMSIIKHMEKIRTILTTRNELSYMLNINQSIMESLINFLKPFKAASEKLESNSCTIPLVVPWFYKLQSILQPIRGDSVIIKALKSRALDFLTTKFKLTNTHKIATFLHPAFKRLTVLSLEEERTVIFEEVRSLLIDQVHPAQTELPRAETEVNEPAAKRGCFETDSEDYSLLTLSDYAQTPINAAPADVDEVMNYLDLPAADNLVHVDVLAWWKLNAASYPKLAKLARTILNIPASSASSERNFSSAGNVMTERRTRLRPNMLDSILYLHNNELIGDLVADDDDDEQSAEELDEAAAIVTVPE